MKLAAAEVEKIGTFTVKNTDLVLSDPCYSFDLNSCTVVAGVLPGTYHAFVSRYEVPNWGVRNCQLLVVHERYLNMVDDLAFEEADLGVGVDSGQAGIFDIDQYRPYPNEDEWYESLCRISLNSPLQAGVVEGGVVSVSGFGDGVYDAFFAHNADERVVGVQIVFINEQDLEDEEDHGS